MTFKRVKIVLSPVMFILILVGAFQNCAPQKLRFYDSSLQKYSNPSIHMFKPALAIRNTSCIFCHASVVGNVITDFGTDPNNLSILKNSIPGINGSGDYSFGNNYDWRANNALTTNFIQGTIYLPPRQMDPRTIDSVLPGIAAASQQIISRLPSFPAIVTPLPVTTIYTPDIPLSFSSIAAYTSAVINHRTPAYLDLLRNDPHYPKKAHVFPQSSVREVIEVNISTPSAEQLRTNFKTQAASFFAQTPGGYPLHGFWRVDTAAGPYYANDPLNFMECDGDVFVDGIVYLKDLKLRTKTGCRIHATRTIFVDATVASANNRPGVIYDRSVSNLPNLGLMSSTAIIMGAGKCSRSGDAGGYGDTLVNRSHDERSANLPTLNGTGAMADYAQLASGGRQLFDAGDCAGLNDVRRSVDFSHVILNAPIIHSRYTGDILGVLIAKHMVGSLGRFSYEYDATFNSVPIFPVIPPEQYFNVNDCALFDPTTYQLVSDQAQVVGNQANFKSCVPDHP